MSVDLWLGHSIIANSTSMKEYPVKLMLISLIQRDDEGFRGIAGKLAIKASCNPNANVCTHTTGGGGWSGVRSFGTLRLRVMHSSSLRVNIIIIIIITVLLDGTKFN